MPSTIEKETWEDRPDLRQGNRGLGTCNTGSGIRGIVCVLGGIGCNVDHERLAYYNRYPSDRNQAESSNA